MEHRRCGSRAPRLPLNDEIGVTKNNGRYNNFENGTVTWSSQTGARLLYGPVRDRWANTGREDGPLGVPLADEQSIANNAAHFADFENGSSIWWTSLTGAHEISSDVRASWFGAGGYAGSLGFPTEGATTPGANAEGITLKQVFEGGIISLIGQGRALIGTYDPTPDSFPEPSGNTPLRETAPQPQARAIPDGATWPPPGISANYDTAAEVGGTVNPHRKKDGELIIRQGYWSDQWEDGWGQDKAEHRHGLRLVESIEFVLESKHWGPRSDSSRPGTDFYAYAIDQVCKVDWSGRKCEEVQRRVVHAIYDPTPYPDGYKLAPAGAPGPVGVITAYCGGGTSPLAGTDVCDLWVDAALSNPIE